jgi:hypothetical protein
MKMRSKAQASISNWVGISIVLAFIILLGLGVAMIFGGQSTTTQSTTTSTSSSSSTQNIDGIVTGYVTVGPSQPVCLQNESCTMDISGYSLEFTFLCQGESTASPSTICETQNYSATISPSGHYSALLPAGTYSITGLKPSCNWQGCATTFPQTVVVQGGNQLVLNLNIDTEIR